MTDEVQTDENRVQNMIEQVSQKAIKRAFEENVAITTGLVSEVARTWAYEADFYDILMLLDIVGRNREPPAVPSTDDGHWRQNDGERLRWMGYIRDLGDSTMRYAVMDHLASLKMAEFERQDDYVFDANL